MSFDKIKVHNPIVEMDGQFLLPCADFLSDTWLLSLLFLVLSHGIGRTECYYVAGATAVELGTEITRLDGCSQFDFILIAAFFHTLKLWKLTFDFRFPSFYCGDWEDKPI